MLPLASRTMTISTFGAGIRGSSFVVGTEVDHWESGAGIHLLERGAINRDRDDFGQGVRGVATDEQGIAITVVASGGSNPSSKPNPTRVSAGLST